jgi:hypothetical protein
LFLKGGTRWRRWLSYCATSRKVAGSIPDEVIGFSNRSNPSSRTMTLGSTKPLTEMRPKIFLGLKCGQCVRLTTLPPSVSRLSTQNVGASMSHNRMGLHGLLQGERRKITQKRNMASCPRRQRSSKANVINKSLSKAPALTAQPSPQPSKAMGQLR